MATFDDFDGVYFTIQALRLYHREMMKDVEIVVVDNAPESQSGHSQRVRDIIQNWVGAGQAGAKYVGFNDRVGTSASRDQIFKVATGDAVLVVDCHILVEPDAIRRLIEFYDANPTTDDLYTGPLRFDDLDNITTHFDDTWRAEMWGIWAKAWRCKCGEDGVKFSTYHVGADGDIVNEPGKTPGHVAYRLLSAGMIPLSSCFNCGDELPSMDYPGHQQALIAAGYYPLGVDNDDEPFEIPGNGLGLFSCRRESWLGFNEDARGFGGEEMYIHEKFRQAGQTTYSLPFLKWVHRFGRVNRPPYPLTRWNKVRNYVLEHNELDLPLDRVREHFVDSGLFKLTEWNDIIDDAKNVEEPDCNTCGDRGKPKEDLVSKATSIDGVYQAVKLDGSRDLNQHVERLRSLAELKGVDHITEFSKRRESTVAFLRAEPTRLVSHNVDPNDGGLLARLPSMKAATELQIDKRFSNEDALDIEETDLLFIKTHHAARRLEQELRQYAPRVRRFIVLHGTQTFGIKGEDGGPGLLDALRPFMIANPEWSVIEHEERQHGLTILSRLDEDKPPLPATITMAGNFVSHMASYVVDGLKGSTAEELEERLAICSICPSRRNDRCSVCGCPIMKKATKKAMHCDLGKWPKLEVIE